MNKGLGLAELHLQAAARQIEWGSGHRAHPLGRNVGLGHAPKTRFASRDHNTKVIFLGDVGPWGLVLFYSIQSDA